MSSKRLVTLQPRAALNTKVVVGHKLAAVAALDQALKCQVKPFHKV
jgi:hypothetical protein